MQIIIGLPLDLEQNFLRQAAQSNIPLQALILQVLRRVTKPTSTITSQWSEIVLAYKSISDFPKFESYRDEFLSPREPEHRIF